MVRIPNKPPDWQALLVPMMEDRERFGRFLASAHDAPLDGAYLHWDELRRRPAPEGTRHEEWWLRVKLARNMLRRELPLRDAHGRPFGYGMTDRLHRLVYQIDRDASGRIEIGEEVTNRSTRDRYIINSITSPFYATINFVYLKIF